MPRNVGRFLAAFVFAAGCSVPGPTAAPPTATAALSVMGSGTFECGNAFHGCTAWFLVRPPGRGPGRPSLGDAELRPTGDGRGRFALSGAAIGGPGALSPGDYSFAVVITEVSDIEPFVLGTHDQPGTGVVTTTVACTMDVTVPAGTQRVAVAAEIGPACRIGATFEPPS
jgi:hypothetical protein